MFPKASVLTILLLSAFFASAQMPDTFGKVTKFEKNLVSYEKDPSAYAVVLYERGDNYFKLTNERILIVKEFHTKIKVLDEKGFDRGVIEIPLYHDGNTTEKLTKIKAVTHNGDTQFNVLPSEIYTTDASERWRVKKFTFPKIQKGSILEYRCTTTTPYLSRLDGWTFQSDIPKMYSEFNASIPGNYVYNRALIGYLKLDTNKATVKKECFHIPGFKRSGDCEVIKYAMNDIPAFKGDDEFMLSEKNYLSKIDFELSEWKKFDGTSDKFTKSWKDVDKEFRYDADIGRQLTKKGFFTKNVPETLLTQGDELTRAKNIYEFVKNHFTWNGKYSSYSGNRVKEAFNEQKGNTGEINMSLINLLNAADIKTDLMLLSTRKHGLPKKIYPVMSDFNYIVAKTKIDGKDYLLDATDKYNPFDMLPFRALNHYGRVMDFKDKSYWYDIRPETKNKYQIRANVKFNVEEHKAEGVFSAIAFGYPAVKMNRILAEHSEEQYLYEVEKGIEGDFEITAYEHIKERSDDKKVSEKFSFEVNDILKGDMVYFNPFLIRFFEENPFKMEERHYPIDFGYPSQYKYDINIQIPEGYQVHELPKKIATVMGEDKLVIFQFFHQENSNSVTLSFNLNLKGSYFPASDYPFLKDIFKQVTNTQKNSLVILKKVH